MTTSKIIISEGLLETLKEIASYCIDDHAAKPAYPAVELIQLYANATKLPRNLRAPFIVASQGGAVEAVLRAANEHGAMSFAATELAKTDDGVSLCFTALAFGVKAANLANEAAETYVFLRVQPDNTCEQLGNLIAGAAYRFGVSAQGLVLSLARQFGHAYEYESAQAAA